MLDKLNYDDIITLDDYPNEYWRITGFQTNILRSKGEPEITEDWIDVVCPWTGEYNMAFFDEITLVALADEADFFLADKLAPVRTPFEGIALATVFEWGAARRPQIGPPLTINREAKVDALLDELDAVIQTRELMREIDHADVAEYERRADEIKEKIAEVST